MKHTPGPWKLSKSTNYYSITDEQGNYIAPRLYINDEPNAKLMTAAPELLEACKSICGVFEGQEDVPRYVQKARAAIAKTQS